MQTLDPKKIPGSVEVTLEDGTALMMRRPKVRDRVMVAHIENVGEQEVNLIANLTMKTVDDISELWASDYTLLQEQLRSFLSPARKSS